MEALSGVSPLLFYSLFSRGGFFADGQTRPTSGIGSRSSPRKASSGWRMARSLSYSPSWFHNNARRFTPSRRAQLRRTLLSHLTTTHMRVPTQHHHHYHTLPIPIRSPLPPHQTPSTTRTRATATNRRTVRTLMSQQQPLPRSMGWPIRKNLPTEMQELGCRPMAKRRHSHPARRGPLHESRALLGLFPPIL